jgi:uncharacterized membrane protein YciS (DUF1049 family)
MIRFLLIISVVILFIGLNAGNHSNITFWFNEKGTFTDVPIYVSLFGAYVLGAVSVIPFALNSTINRYKKRRKNEKAKKKEAIEDSTKD